MNTMDNMSGGRSSVNKNGWFGLTERGKSRVDEFGYGNSTQDRVLVGIECAGSACTIDDIARNCHISRGQVERVLPRLVKAGMVSDNSGYSGGEF